MNGLPKMPLPDSKTCEVEILCRFSGEKISLDYQESAI